MDTSPPIRMNALNQITSRGVPGYVNVLGKATNTVTVKLNSTRQPSHAWCQRETALTPGT